MEAIDVDAGDGDHFISLVEAAEAEALSKRQKIQQSLEGSYTAALRGSRSSLWQKQEELKHLHKKPNNPPSGFSVPTSGSCFKCGMTGHWARDCGAAAGGAGGGGDLMRGSVDSGRSSAEVADKACPCGSGNCSVLVSNTAKNPGRKFYRCPVREENGGCNFFEWCDNPSPAIRTTKNVSSYPSNSSASKLPCPCGAGPCQVLVTETGKNVGRQYYCCPKTDGTSSCGFFKWCDDQTSATSQRTFSTPLNNTSSQFSGGRTNSSCFKCGQEGHWSRDCPKQSSDSYSNGRPSHVDSSSSGTCFKCGKTGHWARDCSVKDDNTGKANKRSSNAFQSSYRPKYK
ncbi:DNA topoisomerase protein [Dioscorea alata]|uniref:DNA topoisomerase protein n=1 Tax=Dioscorea alata TaxID=55571 RepID=A0ACB7VMA9_DIOAL|nr:DNA topoisomerase protein [Dioscorea alata]